MKLQIIVALPRLVIQSWQSRIAGNPYGGERVMLREAKILMAGAALALICAPFPGEEALAQASQLEVKKKKAYKNKPSGITLPYVMTGFKRHSARSYDKQELNISVQYASDDESEFLSVYIFRMASGDPAVWFDRARVAIEARGMFGKVAPPTPAAAFSLFGMEERTALRISYAATDRQYTSTGLMMIPVGDWLVKIRASSKKRSVEELDAWMDKAVTEIAWPSKKGSLVATRPVADCETDIIVHDDAGRIAGDVAGMSLMTGLLGTLSRPETATAAAVWCRDAKLSSVSMGVYRANNSDTGYLLAPSDAGVAISAGIDSLVGLLEDIGDEKERAESAEAGQEESMATGETESKPSRYAISLILSGRKLNFAPRDKLPSPDKLMQIVQKERSISANTTWPKKEAGTIEVTFD